VAAYALGSALDAAERALRESTLSQGMAGDLPDAAVRRVMPSVLDWAIDDRALASELAGVDPLAVAYGLLSTSFVALLVLLTSGTTHARDLASGATRFVLTRCDRWSWSLGKLVGHAALLAVGLVSGALVTAVVGGLSGHLSPSGLVWLARASFRTWVYGLAYLGIFSGVAIAARRPSRARLISVAVLFCSWLGHALAQAAPEGAPARYLVWIFPGHYPLLLWSPRWVVSVGATAALLAMGAVAFFAGQRSLARGDA
jgi:hypothetical protein